MKKIKDTKFAFGHFFVEGFARPEHTHYIRIDNFAEVFETGLDLGVRGFPRTTATLLHIYKRSEWARLYERERTPLTFYW